MRDILIAVLVVAQGLALLPVLYLVGLTVAGVLGGRVRPARAPVRSRVAVLVPAHNEEVLLPRLLESLERQDYPRGLSTLFVVADNCADSTADVGRRLGARVFERHDLSKPGKGHALEWLIEQVRATGEHFDAFVFLDADCVVSPNFLTAMNARLQAGERVAQGYYVVANPTASWVTSLRAIALALMHYVRPRGRQVLGLSCGLFGTGMAFDRRVIERHGWGAHSLVEDVEHYLELTRHGVRVAFAPEAVVAGEMPSTLRTAASQNERWERGRVHMALRRAPALLWEGVLRRDAVRIDAAIEQTIPPLSVLFLAVTMLTGAAFALGGLRAAALGIAAEAGLAAHLAAGLALTRPPARAYMALAMAPWFVVWKSGIYVRSLLVRPPRWVRTWRPGEGGRAP